MIYSQLKVGSRIFWRGQGCEKYRSGIGVLLDIESQFYVVYAEELYEKAATYFEAGCLRLSKRFVIIYKVEEILIEELLTCKTPLLQKFAVKLLEKQSDDSN